MPASLLRLLLLGLLAPLARGFKLSAPGPGRRLQESCGSTIGGGLFGGGEPFGTSCDDSCSESCDTSCDNLLSSCDRNCDSDCDSDCDTCPPYPPPPPSPPSPPPLPPGVVATEDAPASLLGVLLLVALLLCCCCACAISCWAGWWKRCCRPRAEAGAGGGVDLGALFGAFSIGYILSSAAPDDGNDVAQLPFLPLKSAAGAPAAARRSDSESDQL